MYNGYQSGGDKYMNSDTFNRFIDTLFTILDRLEKKYSAEDVIKEFKKVLKKAYFTEGAIIRDVSEEEEKEMIHNTELKLSKQEGFAEGKAKVKLRARLKKKSMLLKTCLSNICL